MSASLLAVAGLNVRIGEARVVSDASFEIGAGEILGLVGASGSGKSMTALAITRLLPPALAMTGTVRADAPGRRGSAFDWYCRRYH